LVRGTTDDFPIPEKNNGKWARGMNTGTYKNIEKLEADLWEAADNLRANSKLTSSSSDRTKSIEIPPFRSI
jgi:hypothetical protein